MHSAYYLNLNWNLQLLLIAIPIKYLMVGIHMAHFIEFSLRTESFQVQLGWLFYK